MSPPQKSVLDDPRATFLLQRGDLDFAELVHAFDSHFKFAATEELTDALIKGARDILSSRPAPSLQT